MVRSHAYGLPKKVRELALRTRCRPRRPSGKLIVVEARPLAEPKTAKALRAFREARHLQRPDHRRRRGRRRTSRAPRATSPSVDVLPQQGANVYDILRRDTLVLTRDAVQHLEARLK